MLSFPAYARDATAKVRCQSRAISFHFPLMREMQRQASRQTDARTTFISRLCARCNLRVRAVLFHFHALSFPAYARDATSRGHFPYLDNKLSFPAYARDATDTPLLIFSEFVLSFPAYARDATPLTSKCATLAFISRLCARCNSCEFKT